MQNLPYTFKDADLATAALTHRSMGQGKNNQRLEFLGDRVLGLAVAEMLFAHFPNEQEGELARRHAQLVSRDALVAVANALGLGQALILSASEEAAGRTTASNLEDACEALLGAIYLDGGYEAAQKIVQAFWQPMLLHAVEPPKDAKTMLQEWLQARGKGLPVYSELSRTGPDHAPHFRVEVSGGGKKATGEGNAKRMAEQAAAAALLEVL